MPDQPERPSSSGRRVTGRITNRITHGAAAALAVTAVLLVVGIVALTLGLRGTPGRPQPAAVGARSAVPTASAPPAPIDAGPTATPGSGGPGAPAAPRSVPGTSSPARGGASGIGNFLEASEPTGIEIPSIGVRSTHFVPLGIQRDGTISVPGTAQEVGLYGAGPTPGQLGPAVLAAHVDTPSGVPGIFYELSRVKAGDVVKVSRRDGSHLTFTVDRVAAFKKTQFPTELVYKGDFTRAEIRLVTCGGPTDSRNEYRDNVVVFGHLSTVT
ncbi:sortase domain-containing protein [Terrabacter sp. 2YAF2]|uniref:sortase domain-containing protein n=1 Tax=Terrabacter sp. 2YAF2 TaxID=3233026 RepID=UPI003F9A5407